MDLNLSEICAILGDRIDQYNNSNRKRKISKDKVMTNKVMKLRAEKEYKNLFSHKYISTSTPVQIPKPSNNHSPASFSSAIKTIQETPKRRVLRVHRKIISNARRLTFDNEDVDNI